MWAHTAFVVLLVTSSLNLAYAQTPPWAGDTVFSLNSVEMTADYPGGFHYPREHVTIRGDGSYQIKSSDSKGERIETSREPLAASTVYELLNEFLHAQFFDLPDELNGGARAIPVLTTSTGPWPSRFRIRPYYSIMDATYVELSLTIAGHPKRVRCWYDGSPKALIELGDEIHKVVGLGELK
jgi:hypothetical protein